jgi:hypothetical protein
MSAVAAAFVSGAFAIIVAVIAYEGAKFRRDLDACLRDRKQLRQTLQLIVSALVGLLTDEKRDELLIAVERAVSDGDGF